MIFVPIFLFFIFLHRTIALDLPTIQGTTFGVSFPTNPALILVPLSITKVGPSMSHICKFYKKKFGLSNKCYHVLLALYYKNVIFHVNASEVDFKQNGTIYTLFSEPFATYVVTCRPMHRQEQYTPY